MPIIMDAVVVKKETPDDGKNDESDLDLGLIIDTDGEED
jgi:hypothetical protein